jgi:hypothetical protein
VNDTLSAAIEYANRGWYVFPCAPRGKTPLTNRGVRDASGDVGLVSAWWDESPRANIGIACGPSGLLVVDIDGPDAMHAWSVFIGDNGGLRRTLIARTGKGVHFYFAGEGRSSAGRIAPHVDTRGVGGYVIAPPSIHGSGAAYRWLDPRVLPAPVPGWLLERLERGAPAPEAVGQRRWLPLGIEFTAYGKAALAGLREDVLTAEEGQRNDTLNGASYRAGRLAAAGELDVDVAATLLVEAAVAAGLPQEEAARTFWSGTSAGLQLPAAR